MQREKVRPAGSPWVQDAVSGARPLGLGVNGQLTAEGNGAVIAISRRRGEYTSGPVTALTGMPLEPRESRDRLVSFRAPLSPEPGLNPGREI